MRYIVTIKLLENLKHNPKDKKTGQCPIHKKEHTCTDCTGEHHSFLISGNSIEDVRKKVETKFYITRIEEVDEK